MTAEDFVAAVRNFSQEEKQDIAESLGIVQPQAVVSGQRRTVEERPRSVEAPVEMEIAPPPPKPPPKPGVIFKSPHMGLWQVLKKSWKERLTDDDYEIHAPMIAEFEKGTYRTADEEKIALMRKKIEVKRARGGPVEVVEFADERVKKELDKGGAVEPVKNKSGVTVDTPLSELVS
jgi:hypothetical protein